MVGSRSRRKRLIVIGSGIVLLLLLAFVAAGLWLKHRAQEVPDHFPRPEPAFDARRAPWPPKFGVNANMVAEARDPALLRRQFDAIAAAGLGWVRIGATWPWIQPQEDGPYDWSLLDEPIAAAARAGLDVAPVIQFTPKWASNLPGSDRALAKDPADSDRFVVALVRRYGPGGSFWKAHPELRARPVRVWELWNEENAQHFFAAMSGRTFGYQAVLMSRAIRAVDPRARLVLGGLVGTFESAGDRVAVDRFLRDMLDAQPSLTRLLDAIGLHVYGDAANVGRIACRTRALLDQIGFRRQALVLNEFGSLSQGPGSLPERERGALLASVVAGFADDRACGGGADVRMVSPYTWWTPDVESGNLREFWGIAETDGRLKPSGRAYAEAVRRVGGR
ncbi:beta-galactosidase [Patulibacter defluvii]|uniref:beta-galactosidase n=1 Tax=Patulibacter defluvii TaxID=3095358 RepID=UPI002A761792|nr:beta-galactosidase [Patulibacter sp. DM4]